MLLKRTLIGNPNQHIRASRRWANDTDVHGRTMQMTHSSSHPSKHLIPSVSVNCLVLRCILSRVRTSRLALSPGEVGQCWQEVEITLKNFLCSRLWLEVHTHFGQLSPLLRHALSFLSVTKPSQPASPTGFSCLGDLAPSRRAAAGLLYGHLHGVLAGLQQPASLWRSRDSSTKCTCHPSNKLGNCGTTPSHRCAAPISHRVAFRFRRAILLLTVSHGMGLNHLENPGQISWFIPQGQNYFIPKLWWRIIFQAYENVIWIPIGGNVSKTIHHVASTAKKISSKLPCFKVNSRLYNKNEINKYITWNNNPIKAKHCTSHISLLWEQMKKRMNHM